MNFQLSYANCSATFSVQKEYFFHLFIVVNFQYANIAARLNFKNHAIFFLLHVSVIELLYQINCVQ